MSIQCEKWAYLRRSERLNMLCRGSSKDINTVCNQTAHDMTNCKVRPLFRLKPILLNHHLPRKLIKTRAAAFVAYNQSSSVHLKRTHYKLLTNQETLNHSLHFTFRWTLFGSFEATNRGRKRTCVRKCVIFTCNLEDILSNWKWFSYPNLDLLLILLQRL